MPVRKFRKNFPRLNFTGVLAEAGHVHGTQAFILRGSPALPRSRPRAIRCRRGGRAVSWECPGGRFGESVHVAGGQRALTAGLAPRAGLLQNGRKKMSVRGVEPAAEAYHLGIHYSGVGHVHPPPAFSRRGLSRNISGRAWCRRRSSAGGNPFSPLSEEVPADARSFG